MKLSISGRYILIAVVGVIASSVIILCISTIMMSRLLTQAVRADMYAVQSVVANMLDEEEDQLQKTIRALAAMPSLVDAVYEKDIDRIIERAQTLRQQFEYDVVIITDANGVVLARGHSDIAGDDISHRPMMAAALSGEVSSGVYYDENALVPFSVRSFSPIYKNGTFAGILITGIDVGSEAYVDNIHRLTNLNFSIFYGDTRYMTNLIDENGNRIVGTVLTNEQIVNRVLHNGETVVDRYELFGEMNMVAVWPIMDPDSNNIVGMWAISNSLTQQNRDTLTVILIVIFCSLLIITVTILIASNQGKRIAKPIGMVTDYATAVAGGDLDAALEVNIEDIKRNIELEQLVDALNTMVATLKDRIHEIEIKRNEADAANQYKSSFLANMSHEIRTPMNVILGLTEILMRNEKVSKAAHEELVAIYSSGDLLLNIINDILDLSKIEVGKFELIMERYDLASLINDTVALNLMRVESKQIEFKLEVDENLPSVLIGDEIRIKQVLNNILSNAFKYTERGEVIISFTFESKEHEEATTLIITVSDTGYGMTEEEVAAIYEEYTRFHIDPTRSIAGTGLGMSITQNLVRMMNGEIKIDSKLGTGTVLTIRIPQGQTDAEVLGKDLSERLQKFQVSGMRQLMKSSIICEPMPYGSVLIVDDVESNLFVARGLLTPYGLNIETVTSGYHAIDKIKSGNVYDIVFMDHMMPKMDGIEATKIIRDSGYSHPIVALTANAVVGQMDIFLKNGFDDFISKPIDVRYMNTVLKKYVRDKQPPEVIEAAHAQAASSATQTTQDPASPTVPSHLAELFVTDALTALEALEDFKEKAGTYTDEDFSLFSVTTHGMKTALINVNEHELSVFAGNLEKAGLKKNRDMIFKETSVFIDYLREVVSKHTLQEHDFDEVELTDADYSLLKEKLLIVKAACETMDIKIAKDEIAELRQSRWSPEINSQLGTMSKHLMSGDYDEVISDVGKIIDSL